MNRGRLLILAGTVGSIVACGGISEPGGQPTPTSSSPTLAQLCAADPSICATDTPAPAATPTPNNLEGPVGTVYTDTDSSNNEMSVTLTSVEDPVNATNSFEAPDNGTRYVAAKFKIVGVSGTFSDDANSDATVIGSDGQTYNFNIADVRACTNFNYGEFSVVTGQTSVGCVVFQVPNGVKVAQVEWGGGYGGNPAIWDVG